MSKGNTYESELLNLVLNNIGMALVGDATGIRPSTVDGSLYVALHSADPGEAGAQNTSEVTYTGYARVPVARNPGSPQWTVASGAASNAAAITFGKRTDVGTVTATHFSVGTALSGAGKVLYKGILTDALPISLNIQPEFPIGDLDITED
jgi:hypothetical protein